MLLSNITAETEHLVGYVPDPSGRGTVSLVLSCLLTLLLCVWQALHLNVPRQGETAFQCMFENARWIIAGIYAPELVVFTAWRQWSSSKILSEIVSSCQHELKKSAGSDNSKSEQNTDYAMPSVLRHSWTQTHSFFASTGGFAFDLTECVENVPFLPPDCPSRLTITARGMALLARCGRLPDIAEEDILDKSKANGLAKALVMIQATWMLLQTIGRLIAGLPVTLLEVNTIAHVLCALLMYAMWWHKPLLAKEPIIIRGMWVPPLCAFMLMSSGASGAIDEAHLKSETIIKTLFASLHLYAKTPETELVALHSDNPESLAMFRLFRNDCTSALQRQKTDNAHETAFFERRPKIANAMAKDRLISQANSLRWKLASQAIQQYPNILATQTLLCHNDDTCIHFKSEELVAPRVQNWPWDDLLRNINGLTVGVILWFSNLCYGGVHASAWNEHFPSIAEKWLWRTSALYIGFCGGLWIVLNWVTIRCKPVNEFWERWMDGEKGWISSMGLGILVVGCGGALCAARGYIVIEAFLSIRSLPVGAYETPDWTQVVPHF